jgi:radical SAM superfamily enzyme with C-terminal helix-hairpin-helix motif
MEAIELLSKVGGRRGWNGQPSLLAGVNFVLGLPAESRKTYDLNRDFLQSILDRGLLVRRINIRKVIPVRGTPLWERRWSKRAMARHSRSFIDWVRKNIDRPMLKRLYPVGTVMRGLVSEVVSGSTAFSRFPGSYPVIVGVKEMESPRIVTDGIIVDHGFRSLTALPQPIDINVCKQTTLESIPGIGPRRAARIIRSRPIRTESDLEKSLEGDNPGENVVALISQATSLK